MDSWDLTILLSSFLLVFVLVSLIRLFYNTWWKPNHIQKLLRSRGIQGPPYKLFHGNSKEVINMTREAMKSPIKEATHDIFQRVQPHIHQWMKLYGRNVLHWPGYRAELIITEPDLIKEILNNKNGAYVKTKPNEYVKKLLGDGLLLSEGKKWSKQRKLANHAFHVENLKGMVPMIILSVEKMLETWGPAETKEIEVFEQFRVLTSDVISRTAFGSNSIEGQKIFDMVTKMGSIIAGNFHKVKLPLVGKITKYYEVNESEKLEREIRESFLSIIKRQKEKMQTQESNGYESCYLELLINANQDLDENKRISVDEMIDECKTFYFAGHETTMSLLTWSTFLLAIHTDWQEKARKEVFDIFGKNHPTTEDNGIGKMKTMSMIINETLRLYPAALNLRRTAASQVKLGNYLLPANLDIIIPPLVTHNDPELWGEDVFLFKPDRFAEGVSKAVKNTSAYLPFGMGPHICVGLNLATIETKITIAMILQRYTLSLSPSYSHSPIQHLTTHPQHGVQIILHGL